MARSPALLVMTRMVKISKKNNLEKGFTLLEISVVSVIIVILSTVFLVNYKKGQTQFALERSAHQIAQALRISQDAALAGERINNVFPEGGYGVYFNKISAPNSYISFADCGETPDKNYTELSVACGGLSSEMLKTNGLEEGIKISGIYINSSPADSLAVTFFPPDPVVSIASGANSASVVLTSDGYSRTINIYRSGLIDID